MAAKQQRLKQEIDAAKQQLAEAREDLKRKQRQYALVPYEGPHGTRRRPIYIECLGDRVLLQPEGIALQADDFLPPLDADNPLAAAVRAIREYYVNTGLVRTSADPYPLVVVRPNGASAYAACRAALRGWDDEFGYELVPKDIDLAFPPVDEHLKQLIERTIEEARWKRKQLAHPQPTEMLLGVNSRRGGFVRQGQAGQAGTGRSGFRGGHPSGGASGSAGATSPRQNPGGAHQPHEQRGTIADGNRSSEFVAAAAGRRSGESVAAAAGRRSGESVATGDSQRAGNASGVRPDSSGQREEGADQPSGPADFDSLAHGAAGGAGGGASASGCGATHSIARTHGANWALPGAANGAIAIQRPVSMLCRQNELQLLPESGTAQQTVTIPFSNSAEGAVRDMVSALWSRVDSWGIAGTGTYWKPVIEVHVPPEGETRFQEMARLLEDSGINLIRR